MDISVIIPTLNEEETIEKTLDVLSRLVNISEIVVADGGSDDRTLKIVDEYEKIKKLEFLQLENSSRGAQLNAGAKHASGDVLWFVHADTRPVQGSGKQIKKFLNYSEVLGGNFDIIFSGNTYSGRFLTWLYPHLRSIGLAYGDSAFFVRRETFEAMGGFRDYPLFEDVDFYQRIRKRGRFVKLKMPVTTSSRRFENRWFPWIFLNWVLRQGLFWVGVSPRWLGKSYKKIR